jgi:hypothetical protein
MAYACPTDKTVAGAGHGNAASSHQPPGRPSIIQPVRTTGPARPDIYSRPAFAATQAVPHGRFRRVAPPRHQVACAELENEDSPPWNGATSHSTASRMHRRGIVETGGQMCGLFAVDIAGFTDPDRDEQVQLHLRDAMYRMLERAFDGAAVPWHACLSEDRGDGALVVVPPSVSVAGLADPLPERLCGHVRVHNRVSSKIAHMQLRAAAHVGYIHHDDHGFAGDAVNHLFRLLDAPRLKQLLAASSSELAFITSDYFYEAIVRRHPTLVDPAAFQQVMVDVRHGTARGWVYLPGAAPPTAGILPFGRPA